MKNDIFQAIADPTRRAILSLVAMHAMTPSAIAAHFDTTRQAVSKHVQVLADCGLLKQEAKGRENYYHFNAEKMKEFGDWLEPFRQMWEKRFDQLDTILKTNKQ